MLNICEDCAFSKAFMIQRQLYIGCEFYLAGIVFFFNQQFCVKFQMLVEIKLFDENVAARNFYIINQFLIFQIDIQRMNQSVFYGDMFN